MTPHFLDGYPLAFQFAKTVSVFKTLLQFLGKSRIFQPFLIFFIMYQLLYQPGITQTASGNHEGIAVCLSLHFQHVVNALNVPVAYDRHFRNCFLYLTDQIPVGMSAVVLRTGTGMYRNGADAAMLKFFSHFHDIDVLFIPAGS